MLFGRSLKRRACASAQSRQSLRCSRTQYRTRKSSGERNLRSYSVTAHANSKAPLSNITVLKTGVVLGTSCSEAERGSNLAQCLDKIGEAGFNNYLFWFGTQYETDCPSGPTTVECTNPRPQSTKRSIFTRILPTGYDPSTVDRYLKMVFTSPPGTLCWVSSIYIYIYFFFFFCFFVFYDFFPFG